MHAGSRLRAGMACSDQTGAGSDSHEARACEGA